VSNPKSIIGPYSARSGSVLQANASASAIAACADGAMRVVAFLAQIVRVPDFDPARRHPELQAPFKNISTAVQAEIPSAS
jgi:hypothetical protein